MEEREEMGLTVKQRQAVMTELRGQYLYTPPNEKSRILDGFVDLTHLNRSYARSTLRARTTHGTGPVHHPQASVYTAAVLLVTLEEPIKGMWNEALKSAPYKFNGKMNIPLVQLLSAADLFKKPLPLVLPAENMVIDRKKGDSVTVIQKEELPL